MTTSFIYDKAGNVTKVRQQGAEGKTRENGKTTEQNEYDKKHRVIKNTDADGIEIRCRYGIQDEQR